MDYSADCTQSLGSWPPPQVLERGLEALGRVVPYDLAAVFRLEGTWARVIAAAGPLAKSQVRRHAIDLRRLPTVVRALEARQPIPFRAFMKGSFQ